MKLKIGVYGSAVAEAEVTRFAQIIGEEIAKDGNIIITGACRGLPLEAVKAAKALGGYSIGYSASNQESDHERLMKTELSHYDELILIPQYYKHKDRLPVCLKYRNVSSVADCDAAIFISGRWGTLNEFAIAYDMGKIIGVLSNVGKFSSRAQELINFFGKETAGKVVFDEDPRQLYKKIIEANNDITVRI